MAFKPHNGAVLDIAFNGECNVLATTGDDGIVFFFNCLEYQGPNKSWTPLRFVPVTPAVSMETGHYTTKCSKLAWIPEDSNRILCTCSDGILREFDVSELSSSEVMLNKEVSTYEASFPVKELVSIDSDKNVLYVPSDQIVAFHANKVKQALALKKTNKK
jgi:WD40 repeat protein